jgi:hypothetical protein
VTRKWKKHNHTRYYSYAIQFEDGDYIQEIGAKYLIAYPEYQKLVALDLLVRHDPQTTRTTTTRTKDISSNEDDDDERKRPATEVVGGVVVAQRASGKRATPELVRSNDTSHRDISQHPRPYTPKELQDHRCQNCVQCHRRPCGLCDICATERSNYDECCYQKVRERWLLGLDWIDVLLWSFDCLIPQ